MRRSARLVFVLGVVLAAISAYGCWFHFSLGPAHGAGIEIAIISGQLALAAFIAAVWLDRRDL